MYAWVVQMYTHRAYIYICVYIYAYLEYCRRAPNAAQPLDATAYKQPAPLWKSLFLSLDVLIVESWPHYGACPFPLITWHQNVELNASLGSCWENPANLREKELVGFGILIWSQLYFSFISKIWKHNNQEKTCYIDPCHWVKMFVWNK